MLYHSLRGKARIGALQAAKQVQSLLLRSWMLPKPTPYEAQILSDLMVEGVHVTEFERLVPESALEIRQTLRNALELSRSESYRECPGLWTSGSASTDLTAEALLTRIPGIYLLGLNEKILRLVKLYLGLPVAYHGAVVRHSLVDGIRAGPRLWHCDGEDFHVFRMVVYLNDVTADGGPFEYIPRTIGMGYRRLRGMSGQLTNERVSTIVPEERWKRVIGPAGTVVLCDTAVVFHHESMQRARNRCVVMIGYSSRRPKDLRSAMAHFPVERVRTALLEIVPRDNYGHVFRWRAGSGRANAGAG